MTNTVKHGFDTTDFGENWVRLARIKSLHFVGRDQSENFVFMNHQGLKFVTTNNPFTGTYNKPEQRENQIGFAGYIGIEGPFGEVEETVSLVKKHAVFIKDESPGRRDFV